MSGLRAARSRAARGWSAARWDRHSSATHRNVCYRYRSLLVAFHTANAQAAADLRLLTPLGTYLGAAKVGMVSSGHTLTPNPKTRPGTQQAPRACM